MNVIFKTNFSAECGEESIADSLDDTLGEKPVETLCASEVRQTNNLHNLFFK